MYIYNIVTVCVSVYECLCVYNHSVNMYQWQSIILVCVKPQIQSFIRQRKVPPASIHHHPLQTGSLYVALTPGTTL